VSVAIGCEFKWVDNLLSRQTLPGVSGGRQGITRRISEDGLVAIALARSLNQDLGVSVDRAVELAGLVLRQGHRTPARVAIAPGVDLVLDLPALERALRTQVIDAMETSRQVRRGRPRLERPGL